VAYHIGYFVEFSVVQLKEGMKYTPLYGLKAVFQIRNGPVLDNIRSIFQKIFIKKAFYICHNNSINRIPFKIYREKRSNAIHPWQRPVIPNSKVTNAMKDIVRLLGRESTGS
jgi:hypothetical protein